MYKRWRKCPKKNMKRPKLWYVKNYVPLPMAWEKCEKSATWYIVNVFQKVSVEKVKHVKGQTKSNFFCLGTKNNVLSQIDWRKAKKEKIHRMYDEYRKPNFPREIQASKSDESSATILQHLNPEGDFFIGAVNPPNREA